MRKFLIASAAALCCAAAFPAIAAPANTVTNEQASNRNDQQQQPTQRQRARDNRLICASIQMSETRIPRRVCKTQAEWDLERDASD